MQKDKLISGLSQDALTGYFLAYILIFWISYTLFHIGLFLAVMGIPTVLWAYVFYKVDREKKGAMAYVFFLTIIGILAFIAMGR